MLKFGECDDSKPIIIKKECSDAEYVDEGITNSPKSEEIHSIKCEEIDIKEELDDVAEISESDHREDYDSFGNYVSSSKKRNIRKSDSKAGKRHFGPKRSHSPNRNAGIKKHTRSHSDNEEHKCLLCTFIADNRLSLKAHLTSHKGSTKEFGCHKCPYETDLVHNLARHSLKHKDMLEVEMYKCPLCPYVSKYKSVMLAHRKLQHDENIKMYKCEKCSFSTKYKYALVGHQLVHADPKVVNKFKCKKCPYWGKGQHYLKKHMKTHYEKLQHSDSPMYKCKLCSHLAKTPKGVKAHMTKYHPDPSIVPRKCAHCPYETTGRQLLIRHINRQHKRQLSADAPLHHRGEEPQVKPFICPPISHSSV